MLELFIYGSFKPITQLYLHCERKLISKLKCLFIFECVKPRLRIKKKANNRVKRRKSTNVFNHHLTVFNQNSYIQDFLILPFLLLHLADFSQVSIAPQWFIVAIHLLYSSITSRLLGNHGSSCLLLSSTEGPSVSGGRWKALRTRCCHTK